MLLFAAGLSETLRKAKSHAGGVVRLKPFDEKHGAAMLEERDAWCSFVRCPYRVGG